MSGRSLCSNLGSLCALSVRQDTLDLKAELARKDELIKKTQEKIAMWKGTLAEVQHPRGPADVPHLQDGQVRTGGGGVSVNGRLVVLAAIAFIRCGKCVMDHGTADYHSEVAHV